MGNEIWAIVIDIVLACNAMLLFMVLKITKDIRIKTINLVSCVLFTLLEAVKLLTEIFMSRNFANSIIIITIYTILIFVTMYSISKTKPESHQNKKS